MWTVSKMSKTVRSTVWRMVLRHVEIGSRFIGIWKKTRWKSMTHVKRTNPSSSLVTTRSSVERISFIPCMYITRMSYSA